MERPRIDRPCPFFLLSDAMSSSPSATRPSIALLILIGLFILLTWAFVQSQILSSYGGITKSLPTEKNKTVVESATVSSIDDNRVTNVANEYKESIAIPDGHPRGKKPFKQRWVHLDLKGAPPRVSYLSRLFPLLPRLGVTGLVIEWEDSFPYEGRLSILKAPHAYTKGDVEEILRLANVSSLEVVPLIQSFGHLEFVLKHDRFAHLRERVTEESSICPSRDESVPLIRDMIKQMRKFHPHSTRIHIGADEAYYVGEDVHCRIRLNNELNQNVERLKLDHIAKVARSALEEGFTEVLAWNDMFDRASVELMREVQLGALITPVVWGYAEDVTREDYFPKGLFTRLSHVFDKIWFASAYKGANGQGNVFISIDRYLANQRSYARLYRDFEKDLYPRLEGIILTGWSRFSHRQPLCELLPSSLPSIVLNLIYLDDVTATAKLISTKTKDFLACPSNPSPGLYEAKEYNQSIFYPPKEQIFTQCVFPSSDLFTAIQELGFLNWKSSKVTTEIEKERLKFNTNVLQMQSKIRPLLSSVLFDDAVDEFLQSKVNSLILSKPTPPPPESIPLQEPL